MTPVLALDVGGSAIKAEIQDAEFRPLLAGRRPTPPAEEGGDGRMVLDAVVELARELVAATPVRAVGVGVPGIVDAERGVGVRSANLGWRNAPVAAHLGAALGLPVVVRHDVAAAGSAELRRGAGRGARDALFVVIGTGIAGAVLAGGSLVAGGAGQAGEIGHIRIRPTGPRCGCGARGCLETFASAARDRRGVRRSAPDARWPAPPTCWRCWPPMPMPARCGPTRSRRWPTGC